MWISYHKPEIEKFIQKRVDQYALEKLYNNHLIPEAIERLNELKIMETYKPKPYQSGYKWEDDDEYSVWPKTKPNPPLKWKDPTPWL